MISNPKKIAGFKRYTRRYARHAPPAPGRRRPERIHTLGKHSRPFDIVYLVNSIPGWPLRAAWHVVRIHP